MNRRTLRRRYGRSTGAALTWTGPTPWGPEWTRWESNKVDFGLKDNKGRAIGSYVEIIERYERTIYGEGKVRYEGRRRFYVSTNALRDGKKFGAIPRDTAVDSLEAAKQLGEKKIAEASKRYAKLVAKGEGRQFQR